MQKLRFQIKGMHCHSCAVLIEEKLKEQPGILSAKINPETNKAVVVFEEDKINKDKIWQAVKSTGDYTPKEIEEEKPKETIANVPNQTTNNSNQFLGGLVTEKRSFMTGFLAGIGLFSFVAFIILASLVFKGGSSASLGNSKVALAQNNPNPTLAPTANTPPTPAPGQVQNFDITKNDHVRGNFAAPITLVEFSDFECPFCEKHYPTLNKILSDYKGKVRLVYKHFPLGFHPNAQKAAESSECASEQDKFWEYHDKLFENQPQGYSLDKFEQWAKDLGLNSEKFNDCLDSGKFAQKVQADYQEGTQKGVNGTPATFVNGQLVSGALPYDSFKQIIESLLK